MPINSLLYPSNVFVPTEFNVANSVRFNSADSPKMVKSSTAGTRTKWTFSAWFKRSGLGASQDIMASSGGASSNNYLYLQINGSDQMRFLDYSNGNNCNKITNRKFRDVSAWYHVVIAVDTTDGTAEDRFKLYINGVRETSFATSANFSSSFATNMNVSGHSNAIGTNNQFNALYWDGYLAEIVLVDGTTLAPADNIGEFDEDSGIWKPIDVSGLTFGNNGFYLDFEASGNLGNDANGGTDFTETNLAATDQSTDTCTNNFATLNPLDSNSNHTFSEGNCKIVYSASAGTFGVTKGTMGVSSGKWYFEIKYTFGNAGQFGFFKINNTAVTNTTDIFSGAGSGTFTGLGFRIDTSGNIKECALNQTTDTNVDFSSGDILSIAFDADNGKLYGFKNGVELTGQDISAGTSLMTAVTMDEFYLPFISNGDGGSGTKTGTSEINFGNPSFAISSGNTDGNGFGNFEYAVPSGFFSLNSKNLAEYG